MATRFRHQGTIDVLFYSLLAWSVKDIIFRTVKTTPRTGVHGDHPLLVTIEIDMKSVWISYCKRKCTLNYQTNPYNSKTKKTPTTCPT